MADLRSYRRTILWVSLLCLTVTVVGNLLVYWPSLLNTFHAPKQTNASIPVNVTNTTILIFNWAFWKKKDIRGNVCKDRFGIPNCILSDKRSLFSKADFVIFHNREVVLGQQNLPLHLHRPKNQGWVWFSLEPPMFNYNLTPLAGKFNYTMSYRRDADFFVPHGRLAPRQVAPGMTVEDVMPKVQKSHLACWIVSNSAPHSRRTAVYNRLIKVINVTVYGLHHTPLSRRETLPTISRCYFYLAFENSEFLDYITEKLWTNALQGGAVPVVLGPSRQNYEAMIPKDSFIHVNDFSSVEELGQFLKQLARDRERYASYFKWKLNYTVVFSDWDAWLVEAPCRICTKLTTLQRPKVYRDLQSWVYI
ncbi:alpha-(1,3)-fucosyltransferase 7-like [Engraulis encrasicolus]|uniref:alpha-(1,3)-fucosyltransferase 7-like n=1 Tax=Engraulis encrasicolus TaxID=184585 RepID=UPI002FCE6E62